MSENLFKLHGTPDTEVFINPDGQAVVSQTEPYHEQMFVRLTADQARSVAEELIRLADEIEKGNFNANDGPPSE